MQTLPAAPAPPPRRQVVVGTGVACLAGTMLIGSMIATWVLMRDRALDQGEPWVPSGVVIPEVASNIMLISFAALGVFAMWAVYAAKQRDRTQVALALGSTGFVAIAIVNAQAYVYSKMNLPYAGETAYGPMFYAVTGVFMALMIVGLAFTVVAAFRYLGGRSSDRDVLTAHAMYWYFVSAAFAVIWFVVYVSK